MAGGHITGSDATFYISANASGYGAGTHETHAVSDLSMSFSRDVLEQELVGQTGNYYTYGGLSVDGSFTNCKFGAWSGARALYSLINGTHCTISGSLESGGLSWHFKSAQITSMDVTLGDSDTIIEASFDWTLLQPYNVNFTNNVIKDY
jgi:hypothetical protein